VFSPCLRETLTSNSSHFIFQWISGVRRSSLGALQGARRPRFSCFPISRLDSDAAAASCSSVRVRAVGSTRRHCQARVLQAAAEEISLREAERTVIMPADPIALLSSLVVADRVESSSGGCVRTSACVRFARDERTHREKLRRLEETNHE